MELTTYPMPVGIKGSGAINVVNLKSLLETRYTPNLVLVEEAIILSKQGMVSQSTIMANYGRILATLELMGIPYQRINPSTFRKEIGLGKLQDKEETVKYVQSHVPGWKAPRKRTGTLLDGQSDAAALAVHAWATNREASRAT